MTDEEQPGAGLPEFPLHQSEPPARPSAPPDQPLVYQTPMVSPGYEPPIGRPAPVRPPAYEPPIGRPAPYGRPLTSRRLRRLLHPRRSGPARFLQFRLRQFHWRQPR